MKDFSQMTDEELDNAIIQKSSAGVQEMDYSSMSDEDLDNMLIQKTMESAPQDRPGEAFVRHFGNSASFGYLPQIQAATEPVIQKALDFFGGDNTDEKLKEQGFQIEEAPSESYAQRRDRATNELNQLSEENPYASTGGKISGAIVNGIATGGALSKALGSTGTATSMGKRFMDAAKSGAAYGAIRNPGDTEGEVNVLQLKDRATNAVKDAATGLVIQGGLEGAKAAGTALNAVGKNLKTFSQNKALKASGAMLKDFRKAVGKKKASELGQTAIDENLVNMGDDVADIAKNAQTSLKDSGSKIGSIYDKADEITSISSGDIRKLNNEFIEESANRLKGIDGGKEAAQKLESTLEVLTENPNPTFGQLRKLRSSIDDKINHAKEMKDLPVYQEELLHLRNKIQDMVKQKIASVNPELSKNLARENKRFSNLSDLAKMSKDKMAREEANAAFGLRERMGGGTGAVVGAIVGGGVPGAIAGGIAGAVTTKVARQYGTPFVAITANKIAKALDKNPELLGKFANPLIESAKHPEQFVATVNALLKKPEFKESIKTLNQPSMPYRGPAKGKK
jgi:hypothetical protein